MSDQIIVFKAKKIITMDHNNPEATHVAVRNGIILAVGDANCAIGWGTKTAVDTTYENKIILPGLIEAHAHVSTGGVWDYIYCGHYDRVDPIGNTIKGVSTKNALIKKLREAPGEEAIVGWGFDPNFLEGPRLSKVELDQVSETRPVILVHSNFHLATVNSIALEKSGISADLNIEGIQKGEDGTPNGELQEFAAMEPALSIGGITIEDLSKKPSAVRNYATMARNVGVTTIADLFSDLDPPEVNMLQEVTADENFPVRYIPIMNAMRGNPEQEAKKALKLKLKSSEKLRMGTAKLFTDGAIQGFTAKLNEPGYFSGPDNGIWNMEDNHFRKAVLELHKAGVKMHIHTNGDAASDYATDVLEDAIRAFPDADHRHTLEHVQLADRADFMKMNKLGICVNLFANHLYYFGDIHWAKTLGPDRASRMDACRDAAEIFKNNFAIHSDSPVTPLAPLVTAWCAINRITEKGKVLGKTQKIDIEQALYCITLGAAYVLKLEREIGSIETGKKADFCIVNVDPTKQMPEKLRDIEVVDTVFMGIPTSKLKPIHSL